MAQPCHHGGKSAHGTQEGDCCCDHSVGAKGQFTFFMKLKPVQHTRSQDGGDRHQHGKNPDYDNVILHVFMWKSKETDKKSNRKENKPVYELELKNYLEKGILELTESLDFDSYPVFNEFNFGLCHEPINNLSEEKLSRLLDSAGEARILSKMDRFHDRVIIDGYEQTFYECVAEALGYPSNKKSFQALATVLPLAKLKSLLPDEIDQSEKVIRVQSILFGISGLFPFKSLQLENNFYNLRQDIPTIAGLLHEDGYYTTATIPNILKIMNLKHIFDEIEFYDDQLTLYDGIGDKILKKFEKIEQSKPWFYYLHLNDIHGQAIFHKDFIHPDFNDKSLGQNQYERMISLIDRWIGEFLTKINLEETLIILTADHGSDVASFDDEMEALSKSAKEKLVVEKNSIIKSGQKITSKLPKIFKPLRRSLSQKYKEKRNTVVEKQISPVLEKIESTQKDPYKKRLLKNLLKAATLPFDERFRIPLLFSGFGIYSPKIISKQIRSVDIFPTLLELLNYENDFKIHGKKLNFSSDDSKLEELAYIESHKNIQEGISENFKRIERFREVEFERNWNIQYQNIKGNQYTGIGKINLVKNKKDEISYQFNTYHIDTAYSGYKNDLKINWTEFINADIDASYLTSSGLRETSFLRHHLSVAQNQICNQDQHNLTYE